MKVVLTDFSDQVWYVKSDKEISVKPCPNCGRPLKVDCLSMEPPVTTIRFHNSKGQILGIFDTNAFVNSPPLPLACHFCGYEEK